MTSPQEYVRTHLDAFRQQLNDLLRIRSVSTSPQFTSEVARAAEWIAADMQRIGLDRVAVEPTAGHPIVYGEWLGAGASAPTVLVYSHYDVQPAAHQDGWDSDPFEPVERDGRIFARGVSDDKGQLFAHLKAAEALLATRSAKVNLKFLIEGEEETGSIHLGDYIAQNRDRLRADVCVISDTGMPTNIDQPCIVYGLRGMLGMELEAFGPTQDLHSGTYGGAVHNPLQALAEIIAQLHHPDGRVAVPGFYDDVLPLADDERAELSRSAWDEAAWREATGVPQAWGEPGYTIHERTSARPTLEINGMAGGYYEQGFKAVLPARAIAKLSCRLVANQDPQHIGQLVRDYILAITPATVRSEVTLRGGGRAAYVDPNTPAMQTAIRAYEKGWGSRPFFTREGASIPIVPDIQHQLGLPVILMGFGLNNDGAHGPNEHFSIEMFRRGILTSIQFCEEIAQLEEIRS